MNGIYCSQCGQKAVPERISFHFIWHELVHFFTHAEKGFVFTSKQMLKAPGKSIISFIEGGRKNFQPPLSYYLIWIGLYTLIFYFLEKGFGQGTVISYVGYFGSGEASKYTISHLNIVLTFLLPVQALYLFAFLTYPRYNYFESLVAILFAIGTIMLLQVLFVLVAFVVYLFTGHSVNLVASDILKILYMGWVVFSLAKYFSVKLKYLRALVVVVLMFGTFLAWRLFFSPIIMDLFFK